jgi:phage terminase large subunit GpA-like protein
VTKGVGGARPIWPRSASRKNVGKVPLFLIGDDSAKGLIYARLRIAKPGRAYLHFPDSYDETWFEQLTAEKIVTKYHRGFAYRRWVKVRPRNEALHVRVENVAALAGLLSMGLSLDREAASLDARFHAAAVRRRQNPHPDPGPAAAASPFQAGCQGCAGRFPRFGPRASRPLATFAAWTCSRSVREVNKSFISIERI